MSDTWTFLLVTLPGRFPESVETVIPYSEFLPVPQVLW